jgi:hypothetical protein
MAGSVKCVRGERGGVALSPLRDLNINIEDV